MEASERYTWRSESREADWNRRFAEIVTLARAKAREKGIKGVPLPREMDLWCPITEPICLQDLELIRALLLRK